MGGAAGERSELTVTTEVVDAETVVVHPCGSLDLDGIPHLRRSLEAALAKAPKQVVVDLARVTFMDSTGLSALVAFELRLRPEARLVLARVPPDVARLLRLTGLEEVFPVADRIDRPIGAATADRDRRRLRAVNGARARSRDPHSARGATWLSGDAALVLGLAATAMPFAGDEAEQAERWLHALLRHGDAGALLASLGVADIPIRAAARTPPERDAPLEDPVDRITEHARVVARQRGATTAHTSDLLQAVRTVYGPTFERVLTRHAPGAPEIVRELDRLLATR